jgi:hypothetical protein
MAFKPPYPRKIDPPILFFEKALSMKIATNEKLVKRNEKIGRYCTIGSLVVLGIGLYLSLAKPEWMSWSFTALILGFLMSQVGIFYGNRWGRSPRPDEKLASSLKGLEEKSILYNFYNPVDHLFLGPAGIWIILPYYQGGKIFFEKNRWRQKGGNWYLKLFAQESLGKPEMDVESTRKEMTRWLKSEMGDLATPPVNVVLTFTNEKAQIVPGDSPTPAIPAEKLKDFFRRMAKEKPVDMEVIKMIQQKLPVPDK